MSTKVPRIQVTLSEDSYALITRLAELQNGSRSAIIAELVDDVAPQLSEMLKILEKAAAVRADKLEEVREASTTLLDLMRPHAEAAAAHWSAHSDLVEASSDPDGGGPPSSNTGVTSALSDGKSKKRASVSKGAKKAVRGRP